LERLSAQHGKASLQAQIEKELRFAGIPLPAQPIAKLTTQADRDAAWRRSTEFPGGKARLNAQDAIPAAKAVQAAKPMRLNM